MGLGGWGLVGWGGVGCGVASAYECEHTCEGEQGVRASQHV